MDKQNHIRRFYTLGDIKLAQSENKLLGVAIRLPCMCNFDCSYCNAKVKSSAISYSQIIDFIDQAIALGITSASFVGEGEPLLYKGKDADGNKNLFDIVKHLNARGVQAIIYTNNSLITSEVAQKLFKYNVVLVAKQNSMSKEVQEKITGVGTYQKIQEGFKNILDAGFAKAGRMSMHSVVCRHNLTEIPEMWRYWRKLGITPQVQIMSSPTKRGKEDELQVTPVELKNLFYLLSDIDRCEFGFEWEPRPPMAPTGCTVCMTSCGLRQDGTVTICAYSENKIGRIPEEKLADIMNKEYTKKFHRINEYIKGKCANCEMNKKYCCYGCRAHQICLSGDPFAEYEFCWR